MRSHTIYFSESVELRSKITTSNITTVTTKTTTTTITITITTITNIWNVSET